MEYCSKCRNVSICKYVSEIEEIEQKLAEIKTLSNSHLYTVALKCNYFDKKSENNIRTGILNEHPLRMPSVSL